MWSPASSKTSLVTERVALSAGAFLAAARLSGAATPEPASLCQQLAAQVRQSAAAVSDRALSPWVAAVKTDDPGTWGPHEIAVQEFLRHRLEARGLLSGSGPNSLLELEHLPGTQVYMGSTMAGTANCQSSMFAEIAPDGSPRALPEPEGYTGPCWNMHGDLGTVSGKPAYIEVGTVSSTTDDTVTRVTPWTAAGWGRACQLTVELNYKFELSKQFCGGERAVCLAAGAIAVDLAREYFTHRQRSAPPMKAIGADQQVPDFQYMRGGAMSPQGPAAVTDAWHILARQNQAQYPGAPLNYGLYTSVFPTFGYHAVNEVWEYSFSYVDFSLFPLMLDGRLYLGAVGHNGVGWREGSRTLFAVYEAPGPEQGDLAPLAGFAVDRVPTGLRGTAIRKMRLDSHDAF
jgi:hypothetical protein